MDWSWLTTLLEWIGWIFGQAWWQGVAGIAQIFAAGVSIYAVVQARKTIELAQEERRESVAPDWESRWQGPFQFPPELQPAPKDVLVWFHNIGAGPARKVRLHFDCPSGSAELTAPSETDERLTRIARADKFFVTIRGATGAEWEAVLTIECVSRVGQRLAHDFAIRTKKRDDGWLVFKVDPVH